MLPELKENVVQVPGSPLDKGVDTIARVSYVVTYPAGFMLLAAMDGRTGDFTSSLRTVLGKLKLLKKEESSRLRKNLSIQQGGTDGILQYSGLSGDGGAYRVSYFLRQLLYQEIRSLVLSGLFTPNDRQACLENQPTPAYNT